MTAEVKGYSHVIPTDLDLTYREALSRVYRWEGSPLLSSARESNLDHVDASLQISNQIEADNPNLAGEIDFTAVNDIIYLHDARGFTI